MTQTSSTALSRIASFAKREDGSVGMILGLAMLPFCMAIALSVDYGRNVHMKQKFTTAVDAATLAAAKMVKDGVLSDDEIKERAFSFFKENVKDTYAQFNDDEFDIKIDRANSRIDINLPVFVPTTFARIGGFEKMAIPQSASVVFQLRDIEVGLALDITGSMRDPVGGGKRKIDALKSAFEKFAKLMLPDTPVLGQKVRLGLAPYSAAINLGSFANAASGGRSVDRCVTERTSAAALNSDMAPGGLNVFRVKTDNEYDIDPTENYAGNPMPNVNKAYYCPTAAITPLSDNRTALINAVNAYKEDGWTAGHIGAQWAWNLVSPEWAGTWGGSSQPEAYTNKKVVKAVILMTDGVFNTSYHNGDSSTQALELCANMKAKGVQVFSLAFGLKDNKKTERDAKVWLQTCATSSDYFVDAANESELDDAFALFAGKINALRLAN